MSKKKDCAFQYAHDSWPSIKFVEDTPLITLDEAKELWNKYKSDFIDQLEQGTNPEMALWIDMKDNTDYHTALAHVNQHTETDGTNLYETKKEFIKV